MNTQLDAKTNLTDSYRYRTFNNYLKEYFGTRVYRVPIDAGFTCPNRDGVRAFGGCTFCDEKGSGAPTIDQTLSVREQLSTGMERIIGRYKAKKFLGYFGLSRTLMLQRQFCAASTTFVLNSKMLSGYALVRVRTVA